MDAAASRTNGVVWRTIIAMIVAVVGVGSLIEAQVRDSNQASTV